MVHGKGSGKGCQASAKYLGTKQLQIQMHIQIMALRYKRSVDSCR